jgi:hypothetical protein
MLRYRSFAPASVGVAPAVPRGDAPFDPVPSAPTATAADIYPLLGSALDEARQVRVHRRADTVGFVTARPILAEPAPAPVSASPSLAAQALRASFATPPAHDSTPAQVALPPRPQPLAGVPPAAQPPARIAPGLADAGSTAAAPLAGLFSMLVQPRDAAGPAPADGTPA